MEHRFSELTPYLDSDMKMMPPDFFEIGWNVHIKPCGKFVAVGEQSIEEDTVINRVIFEKLTVMILIEIHSGLVAGMFLQYCKENK